MYSEETQNYELVTLSEIKFAEGTPHCYYGKSYLKIGDTEYSGKFTQEIVDEKYNRMISCDFDSKYYGDNEKPSEATGVVNLLDQTWAKDSAEDKELFFTAAFGAKKDKR